MSLPKIAAGISTRWKFLLTTILISLAWLYLWYFPWQAELHHILWLQLGVGLVIFIVPGLCIYGLLSDRPNLGYTHVTFGFVISSLISALLGILGRIVHLSFENLRFVMMVMGFILLIIYLLQKVGQGIKFQMDRARFTYLLSILPVLLISFLVSQIVIQRVINSDDLTYLAYLTNWQHSTHLNFNDLIFSEPQLDPPRFWLMSAPFTQAFLAEISKVPAILILGGYYEPFLVILSVLCWYELAITLKLSPRAASASVILQLSFLLLLSEYIHPGAPYFSQLSADKATAAFILAPVFFQSLINLLERPTRNNSFLLLLTGFSLTLMHPIILAYSVFIGGLFVLINKNSLGVRNKLIPMAILIAILIPHIAIRFVRVPSMEPTSFDPEVILNQSGSENLVTRWDDTRYYGFNTNILAMKLPYEENIPLSKSILKWGWILVPILAVIFSLKQQNNIAAQFIVACFALCFLAGFPFTGWIIGYFLNARMLARSVWLFPYGLSAVYMILIIRDYIREKYTTKTYPIRKSAAFSNWALVTLTLMTIGLFSLYMRENNLPDIEKFTVKSQRYRDLAIAGQTLDHQITDWAYVMGSPNLNDLIPGISSKSKLITFRISNPSNMSFYTPQEREERISDSQKLFSKSSSPENKMSLIEKYDIQFLILRPFDLQLFSELIGHYPRRTETIEVGGVIIIRIYP